MSDHPTNDSLLDAGRLLIRMGRSWLTLSSADIERGATAIIRDPGYGQEIIASAVRYARQTDEPVLIAHCAQATTRVERSWNHPRSEDPS